MTGLPVPPLPSQGAALATGSPFLPRLGDLAADAARGGRVGIVVALPGEGASTYHLRPPGGGVEWSAPADASTLRPVQAKATHATPTGHDLIHDRGSQQGCLSILVHYEDRGSVEATLILTRTALERLHSQMGRILAGREPAPRDSP